MAVLRTMVAELFGLFVDDGSLVAAVLAWVVAVAIALRGGLLGPAAAAVLLGCGMAALLSENVLRFARTARNQPAR